MMEPGLGTTHTVHDTHGRYYATANRPGENTLLAYDTLGRAWRKFLNNGLYEEYTYDASNRLISVGLYNPSPSTMIRFESYTYNLANQMTSKTVGGVTTTYTYDLAGQLASESRPGYSCSYTYDANGNRLTKTLNGVTETYTYDDGDKMLTAGSKSYGYDAAGRTTSVVAPGGTTTMSYDFDSRLTTVAGPGINASYTYNGMDARMAKNENSVSTTFVRDGDRPVDTVIRDSFASYTDGTSERRGSTSTFLHSGIKLAEIQTSASATVSATRQYDAYGMLTSSTGTWQGPFGYGGDSGYQEDASGLKLLGYRYYDSSTGRFLTRDPLKDGRNFYAYCDNEPVTRNDGTGLKWVYYEGKPSGWYWEGNGKPTLPYPSPGDRPGDQIGDGNFGDRESGFGNGRPGTSLEDAILEGKFDNGLGWDPHGDPKPDPLPNPEPGGKPGGKPGKDKPPVKIGGGGVTFTVPLEDGFKLDVKYDWEKGKIKPPTLTFGGRLN